MTRIFTDGAESGDVLFWTTSTGVTNTTPGRISGRRYTCAGNSPSMQRTFTGVSEFYARWAWNIAGTNANIRYAWYSSGTEYGSIRRNSSTGTIDIYVGTTLALSGVRAVDLNTWFVVEVHVIVSDSTGLIEFKIDGILQPSYSGDTKPSTGTLITSIGSSLTGSGVTGSFFDDLALNDTNGSVDNSWCGDGHIYALTPNGNGTTNQFVGSDGNSTDNYLLVDEIPSNGDTDYVQSATTNDIDLYNYTSLPSLPAGSTVNRVIVETRAKELSADGQSIKLGVRSGGTESWSSAIAVTTSYARQVAEFLNDPNTSAAWTESAVNALEAGIQVA